MNITRQNRLLIFILLIASCFLSNTAIATNGNFGEALKNGIYQFRHENYDEALEIFKKLSESDPNSSLAAYYLGLTYKRIENYTEARAHLEASLGMTPKIKGALIELIDLLYRLDDIDQAKIWIKVAEEEGVRPAQAAFLKGLILLKAAEYEDAIKAFEDAKSLDAQLTQSADYQIGIAYIRLNKFENAKGIFEDIVSLDPHADIAEYASTYIDAIERKLEREKPLNLSLRFAFEYDSNVLLKPGDTALVTRITDEDDTRQVYDFKGDYTFRAPDNPLTLKTAYNLRISKQNDFGRYDTIINNFTAQPNLSLDNVLVTFPVNYSHTIVDEKNYLSAVALGNINNILLTNSQMVQLGGIYKYKNYLRPPYGDEDRTGNELIGTGGLFHFFAKNKGFLSLRYSFNKDWTEGNNWEYFGNKISAGILIPFWKLFNFNLQGEVFLQHFNNIHTVYGKKRNDQSYSVSSLLSCEIIENTELQFQYTYVNSQSNLNIYEYDRHIMSGAVQYKF